MLGVDLVIPDISYIIENQRRTCARSSSRTGTRTTRARCRTSCKQVNVPVYCTPLAHGLISVKLKEARLLQSTDLREIQAGDVVEEGPFSVEPFQVAHSIPDSVGYAIHTPVGHVHPHRRLQARPHARHGAVHGPLAAGAARRRGRAAALRRLDVRRDPRLHAVGADRRRLASSRSWRRRKGASS